MPHFLPGATVDWKSMAIDQWSGWEGRNTVQAVGETRDSEVSRIWRGSALQGMRTPALALGKKEEKGLSVSKI